MLARTPPSPAWRLAAYALLAIAGFARQGHRPLDRQRVRPAAASALVFQRAAIEREALERIATDEDKPVAEQKIGDPGWWPMTRDAAMQWSEHKDARLGAALAYYSVFSIGPLILIAVAIAGLFFGREAVQGEVSGALRGLLGDSGAQAINGMLAGASKPTQGIIATVIGIATLIFAAIGVVVQLKDAFNTVWEVKTPPGKGIWGFARTYVLSLAGVMALGFLLLISMLLTTVLAVAGKFFAPYIPEAALQVVSFVVSFGVITLLFAMMFKWLPDAKIQWRDVWIGAIGTAALFEIGKFLIGLYIGKQGLESTYGAAASIVIVLIWVYYSAQIVLLGAEFTNVYAKRRGSLKHGQTAQAAA
jgi:membrane protein